MLQLPQDVMARISSLNWLGPDEIKQQFAEYTADCQNCARADLLRSIVIFRIQEQYYNLYHSDEVMKVLDKAAEGKRLMKAECDRSQASKKIVKYYKGKSYEVLLMADHTVEYDGKTYGSLSAAAEAITGTHWNGRKFFGLTKA